MSKKYDDKKFIGNVIRTARKKAGFKQTQFAEKIGMSDKNLGNIENGKQFPAVNNLFRIIEELNLSLQDFSVSAQTNNIQDDVKSELIKIILSSSSDTAKIYKKFITALNETILP